MTAEHFRGTVLCARAGLGIPVPWFPDLDGAGPSAPPRCLEMAALPEGAWGRLACLSNMSNLRAGSWLSSKCTRHPGSRWMAPRAAPAAAGLLGEADGPGPSSPPAPFSPSPEATPNWPLPAASATTQMSQPYDFTSLSRCSRARYLTCVFGLCHRLHRLHIVLL